MRVIAETVSDNDVDRKVIDLVDNLIEEMSSQLDEWLKVKVIPIDALDEAMRHIESALRHPTLMRASNHKVAREYAERKLKFYLKIPS